MSASISPKCSALYTWEVYKVYMCYSSTQNSINKYDVYIMYTHFILRLYTRNAYIHFWVYKTNESYCTCLQRVFCTLYRTLVQSIYNSPTRGKLVWYLFNWEKSRAFHPWMAGFKCVFTVIKRNSFGSRSLCVFPTLVNYLTYTYYILLQYKIYIWRTSAVHHIIIIF